MDCEIKRREIMKTYEEYKKQLKGTEQKGKSNKTASQRGEHLSNLTKEERKGLASLKKKIDEGILTIAQTDKSGRLAVLNPDQYIKAGLEQASKDKEITWKEVKYMKNQTNVNVWWLSEILGYSAKKNKERMQENLIDHGLEVPKMKILIKDHKQWSPGSETSPPSRPVVNGRAGYNAHLSEILSQILEPIAVEMTGAEIDSTEEALAAFEQVNKKVNEDPNWRKINILPKIFNPDTNEINLPDTKNDLMGPKTLDSCPESNPLLLSGPCTETEDEKNDKELLEKEATLVLETLLELERTSGQHHTKVPLPENKHDRRKNKDIRSYLREEKRETPSSIDLQHLYDGMETDFRRKAMKSKSLNEKVRNITSAALCWKKKNKTLTGGSKNEKSFKLSNDENWSSAQLAELAPPTLERQDGGTALPLQELDSAPVMLGGDVKTLYPSLDCITTSEIAAEAIRTTNIKFGGIDYSRLSVYLTLSLGEDLLSKCGLHHIVPKRADKSKAYSLSAKNNKDLSGWKLDDLEFSDGDKREMVALLIQINTIILMSCHIYSFGGRIYLQKNGAGIGLRASACLARILMCHWDSLWAKKNYFLGLSAILFIRYVDDLRIYLNAINKGWSWKNGLWEYDKEEANKDQRTPEQRTREEINKAFDSIIDCLEFTTETQSDYVEDTLPTLDVQIKTMPTGEIDYIHFSKPMASNILLEASTALSKSTVFNCLRHDLVRRLLHTRRETDWDTRIKIIEEYTQLLSNSGHRYSFSKSIILQAITKYEMMVWRSKLQKENKLYLPLHRDRVFNQEERKIAKYVTPMIWYTGENVKDPYRNIWKSKIKRSFNRNLNKPQRLQMMKSSNKKQRFTTTLFVPSSHKG